MLPFAGIKFSYGIQFGYSLGIDKDINLTKGSNDKQDQFDHLLINGGIGGK